MANTSLTVTPPTKDQFIAMLDSGKLQGTILRTGNGSMYILWSPYLWNDPNCGLNAQRDLWLSVGSEGWYQDQEWKELFGRLKTLAGDLFPTWPGEYSEFK